jgi:hypothetical protein
VKSKGQFQRNKEVKGGAARKMCTAKWINFSVKKENRKGIKSRPENLLDAQNLCQFYEEAAVPSKCMWQDGLLLCTENIPNEMRVVSAVRGTYDQMITEKYSRNEPYNKNGQDGIIKTQLTSSSSGTIIEPIRDPHVIKGDRRTYNRSSTGK